MPDLRPRQALEKGKARHAALNDFITERGGWLTSIAGDPAMRFEAPIGSALPEELRGKGYVVTPIGSTTRIDPHATATVVVTEVYDFRRACKY
jgi:hypothetical protein